MQFINWCVYVDDVLNEFAYYQGNPPFAFIAVRQAKKIVIRQSDRLIIINPIPDDDYMSTIDTGTSHDTNHPKSIRPRKDKAVSS